MRALRAWWHCTQADTLSQSLEATERSRGRLEQECNELHRKVAQVINGSERVAFLVLALPFCPLAPTECCCPCAALERPE